jgi:hypothetical protein
MTRPRRLSPPRTAGCCGCHGLRLSWDAGCCVCDMLNGGKRSDSSPGAGCVCANSTESRSRGCVDTVDAGTDPPHCIWVSALVLVFTTACVNRRWCGGGLAISRLQLCAIQILSWPHISTSKMQHAASDIQHPTPNTQYPTLNIHHPTSRIQNPESRIEFRFSFQI